MAAVSLPAAWPAEENQGPLKASYIGSYGPCPCRFIPLPSRSPTLSPNACFRPTLTGATFMDLDRMFRIWLSTVLKFVIRGVGMELVVVSPNDRVIGTSKE